MWVKIPITWLCDVAMHNWYIDNSENTAGKIITDNAVTSILFLLLSFFTLFSFLALATLPPLPPVSSSSPWAALARFLPSGVFEYQPCNMWNILVKTTGNFFRFFLPKNIVLKVARSINLKHESVKCSETIQVFKNESMYAGTEPNGPMWLLCPLFSGVVHACLCMCCVH